MKNVRYLTSSISIWQIYRRITLFYFRTFTITSRVSRQFHRVGDRRVAKRKEPFGLRQLPEWRIRWRHSDVHRTTLLGRPAVRAASTERSSPAGNIIQLFRSSSMLWAYYHHHVYHGCVSRISRNQPLLSSKECWWVGFDTPQDSPCSPLGR